MTKEEREQRKVKIVELYKTILERAPDEPGLNSHLYSGGTLEEIKEGMLDSPEYAELQRRKHFSAQLGSLGNGELLVMGSSPRNQEHVGSLRSIGVEAILNLDEPFERVYDHSWCNSYLNVPLDSEKPISIEKVSLIINFIYSNMVLGGKKIFIHSNNGISRSPMAIILFLMAEKKISFMQALNLIAVKQRNVNPSHMLVTAELLTAVKNHKFEGVAGRKQAPVNMLSINRVSERLDYVNIGPSLLVGKILTEGMVAKFKTAGVDTIVDLNSTKDKITEGASWFSHLHLPLLDDKINEMMPVVIRNTQKYSSRGGVYVMCSDIAKLIMFVENYVSNINDPAIVAKMGSIRNKLMEL